MTISEPRQRTDNFSHVAVCRTAPTPKKQATARLISNRNTIIAVSKVLDLRCLRAVFITKIFCVPIGMT